MNLPTGTVTLLFAEVKHGTTRFDAISGANLPASLRQALVYSLHAHNGTILSMDAGNLRVAFTAPEAALEVAVAIQQIFHPERAALPAGLRPTVQRFRVALHTGRIEVEGEKVVGETVEHTAQLLAAGHSGQILVSAECTGGLHRQWPAGVKLISLGKFQYSGQREGEPVYQVVHADLPTEFPQLRLAGASPTNLPIPWTSFVGRAAELAELQQELTTTRILTLVGSEGIGKSRLAIRLASDLRGAFPDGVWSAELPAIADTDIVPGVVAWALNAPTGPNATPTDALIALLRERKALLVLDAGESNLAACARLVTALVAACPAVKFIICARKGLGLRDEAVYCVPALATSDRAGGSEAERLCQDRASQLPTPLDLNGPILAGLCSLINGVPLALELIVGSLAANPEATFDDLPQPLLDPVQGQHRSWEQTLQMVLDWRYARLSKPEQVLLERLSVFQSGWSLEAATAVCCDEGLSADLLPVLLESLRAGAFIAAEERAGFIREHLRDAVRHYAETRLNGRGEGSVMRQRHAAYFTQLAEDGALGLAGPDPEGWKAYLEREYSNFRGALFCLRQDTVDISLEVRLATALIPLFEHNHHGAEGRALLTRAKEAHHKATTQTEDYDAMRARFFAAIQQARTIGDRNKEATYLNNLARLALSHSDYATAHQSYEQALDLARTQGDPAQEAKMLHCLGSTGRDGGEYRSAQRYYEQARELNRVLGHRQDEAHNLNGLARVALLEGDTAEAIRRFQEGLILFRELGDHAWEAHNMGQILKLSLPNEPLWERTPVHAGTAH